MLFVTSRLRPFIKGMPGMILLILFVWFPFIKGFSACPITITETCGTEYELTLTLTGTNTAENWDVGLPAGFTSLAQFGLTGTKINNKTFKIHGVPIISGTFALSITPSCDVMSACISCPAGCPICNAHSFTIDNVMMHLKAAVDVMLVLDVSGSMNQLVPIDSGTPGTMTKWGVLKDAVAECLDTYKSMTMSNTCQYYRFGTIFFDDNRGDFFGGSLVQLSPANITTVVSNLDSKFTQGATCLGGGIEAAYAAFNRPNSNMIIITDGIQNIEPTVNGSAGPNYMVINNYGVRPTGGFPLTSLNLKSPTNKFDPYTVGIGANVEQDLLENIAAAPDPSSPHNFDGRYAGITETLDLANKLNTAFNTIMTDILALASPQLVDIKRIQVTNSASAKFVVNPSADRVKITVGAEASKLEVAKIQVFKDGKDLSSLVRPIGRSYKTFFLDLLRVRRYEISLSGVYNVVITGPNGLYQVTCMINDEQLEAGAAFGSGSRMPGDSIQLETILNYDTLPVTNASRAVVYVAKPGQDVNDLFAQAGPIDIPANFPGEKGNDAGQLKFEALLALNPTFVAALQPVMDSISLTNHGDGRYSAKFADTKESGVYNFVFRFAGNDSITGPFQRLSVLTTYLDFGTADPSKTIFQIVNLNGKLFFQLTPKNKFDHFIGPNRLGQINILVDGKVIVLTDKLDGSYEAEVPARSFPNLDPKVEVNIKGDVFYNDDYSGIKGNDVPFWFKYWLWIIILILVLLLILFLRRKK